MANPKEEDEDGSLCRKAADDDELRFIHGQLTEELCRESLMNNERLVHCLHGLMNYQRLMLIIIG